MSSRTSGTAPADSASPEVRVFARTDPQQKLDIVHAIHAPPAPPPGTAFSLITGVVARAMDLPRQRRPFGWTHRRGTGP
ncbi:hypothetical protein OG753_35645 [Streptomyces sp. NBC_00029]|uniref:hypothetical protein n=1 Tax=Streptomyces sp. NBC_00029 TaxID=2903613 RepID=UPI00324F4A26